MNRRRFILASAATTAAMSRLHGANDQVRIGFIGTRGRGQELMREFAKRPLEARIAAICDIDATVRDSASSLAGKVQDPGTPAPRKYSDIRALLDDKEIDAVVIATCNHWHALATIWACQAGKDVYVEKPASHNLVEGRRMIQAAERYGRIVQVGMQARSIAHYRRAIELLHGGAIGKVYMAKGICYKRRKSIGRQPDGPVPDGVNYDIWLGPAPLRPFNANRFHYNWHWFWDYGNGDIGNQGVHEMDIARWGLGKNTLPSKVQCDGSRFVYDDDQETPNTQLATFRYDDCMLVFEVRGLPTQGESSLAFDHNNFVGNIFFGSEGTLALDCLGFRIYRGDERKLTDDTKFQEPRSWDNQGHIGNFLAAARARNAKLLHAGIEQGHLSAALCHLANTSYRLDRGLRFDPAREEFLNDAEANQYRSRIYRVPYVVPDRV